MAFYGLRIATEVVYPPKTVLSMLQAYHILNRFFVTELEILVNRKVLMKSVQLCYPGSIACLLYLPSLGSVGCFLRHFTTWSVADHQHATPAVFGLNPESLSLFSEAIRWPAEAKRGREAVVVRRRDGVAP